jgi:histidine triad (HIT) family protein
MKDCVFCKAMRGENSIVKVYENENVLAFLDLASINPGQTVVCPKEHYGTLTMMPAEESSEVFQAALAIGKAFGKMKEWDGFNMHISTGECAGQSAPHAHIQVIPRVGTDGFFWNWRNLPQPSIEEAEEIVEKIREKLTL